MEKTEKNNVTIAVNVWYAEKEKIYPADVSKNNSNHEKQVILLMKKMAFSCSKKLSVLLREITSKNNGDFY